MSSEFDNEEGKYEVDNWSDLEHCVYHGLVDNREGTKKDLTNHRIAHFLSRLTAKLVEDGVLSVKETESFIHSSRG